MSTPYIDTDILRHEASKMDDASADTPSASFVSSPDLGASTGAVSEAVQALSSTSTGLSKHLTSTADAMRAAADDFAEAVDAACDNEAEAHDALKATCRELTASDTEKVIASTLGAFTGSTPGLAAPRHQ